MAERSAPARIGRLAWFGAAWALSYVPIHLYWAFGGLSGPIGIDASVSTSEFRLTNLVAVLVIAGAAPLCLALVHPRGAVLPRALRAGLAYLGGGFALLHWALFSVVCVLQLAGVIGGGLTATERAFAWWNLAYFESWFGVMGTVLVALAWRTRRPSGRTPTTDMVATAAALLGAAVVVWGTFTFTVWLFVGVGLPLLAVAAVLFVRGADLSMTRQLRARLTAGWAILFAAPHVYWATGRTAGLDTALDRASVASIGPWFAPLCAGIAAFCLAGAGLAIAAGSDALPARTRRVVAVAVWLGAGVLIARCGNLVVAFVPDVAGLTVQTDREHAESLRLARWYATVWGPWFVLGAVVWASLAIAVREDLRVSARTDRRRRTPNCR